MFRYLFCFLLITPALLWSQNPEKDKLLNQGDDLFKNGLYQDAITRYEKALVLDARNTQILYSLAKTWFVLGNYSKSKEFGQQVMDINSGYWAEAAAIYGQSLENTGDSEKAQKFYYRALKKFPADQQLNYFLGNNYCASKRFEEAVPYAIKAVEMDMSDASAHLLLGSCMLMTGQKLKCMYSLYYFLLLEPDSERSLHAFDLLQSIWVGIRKSGNPDESSKSVKSSDPYHRFEIELGNRLAREDDRGNELTAFIDQTRCLMVHLSDFSLPENDFWFDNYWKFYNSLVLKKHVEPFCYFVCQGKYKSEVMLWFAGHPSEVLAFANWMEMQ